MLAHHSCFMLHAFKKPAPPDPPTRRENSRKTNAAFDSFHLKPNSEKKNKNQGGEERECTVIRKTGCEAAARPGNKRHYSLPNKEKVREWLRRRRRRRRSRSRQKGFIPGSQDALHLFSGDCFARRTEGKHNKHQTRRPFAYLNAILFFRGHIA